MLGPFKRNHGDRTGLTALSEAAACHFPELAKYIREAFPENEYINSVAKELTVDIGSWRVSQIMYGESEGNREHSFRLQR